MTLHDIGFIAGVAAGTLAAFGGGLGLGVSLQLRKPKPRPLVVGTLMRYAFMEGRESLSGTDRHHAERAWENSRSKRRAKEVQQ